MSLSIRHGLFTTAILIATTQYALASNDSLTSGIPQGYVQVPGGNVLPQSCIREVPSGTVIDAARGSISLNGAVIGQIEKCNPPTETGRPTVVPMVVNSTHSFANAETDINTTAFPNYLVANLTVPPAPTSQADHWLALWTGMQDQTNYHLIQPTLQWSTSSYLQYSSSSWYVVVNDPNTQDDDTSYYTTPFNVSPGDALTLTVWGGSCTSQGSCATWIIETYDSTSATGTYLELDNFTFRMGRVFGGVLEFPGAVADAQSGYLTYNSYSCSDFPGGHGHTATFSNIQADYGTLSSPTSYNVDSNPTWISNYTSYPSNLSGCAPSGHTPFYTTGSGSTVQISW